MQLYPQFYRSHGIRMIGHLANPPIDSITSLAIPRNSIVHYLSMDDVSTGPEPEGLLFKQYDGRILVDHVIELVEPIGSVRPNRTVLSGKLTREYHQRFRKMRPLHDFDKSIRDERTLVIENYAQLNHLFMYMKSIFAQYHKWHNIFKTLMVGIEKRCVNNNREHFVMMDLPKQLPSPAMLKMASADVENFPRQLLETFSKPQVMFVLEMWKLLGPSKGTSIFEHISREHLDRVNVILVENGYWVVINIGKVLSFIEKKDDNDGKDADAESGSTQLQRLFLKLMITMLEQRNDSSPEVDSGKEVTTPVDVKAQTTNAPESESGDDESDDAVNTSGSKMEINEDELNADLAQLDELHEKISNAGSPTIQQSSDPATNILARCDKMAEDGLLSAAEYRRFTKLVEVSKSLPNPYGKGTLEEFRKIEPEQVIVDPMQIEIPKIKGVIDPSMTESTLKAMDRQYISNVMKKDIVNAALSVQAAGVIVTDYSVEQIEDAANKYQVVTMKLNPVDGEGSTVRFRLPEVNNDGEFISNNVKYRLRKQRVD